LFTSRRIMTSLKMFPQLSPTVFISIYMNIIQHIYIK
jgi:hypothetical protein